jgi:hypothetical protein
VLEELGYGEQAIEGIAASPDSRRSTEP